MTAGLDKKRTFLFLRGCILKSLSTGTKTINQIAKENSINWKTVESHLTYLMGKGYAREIFSSQYVRIFEITDSGRNRFEEFRQSFTIPQKREEEEILER